MVWFLATSWSGFLLLRGARFSCDSWSRFLLLRGVVSYYLVAWFLATSWCGLMLFRGEVSCWLMTWFLADSRSGLLVTTSWTLMMCPGLWRLDRVYIRQVVSGYLETWSLWYLAALAVLRLSLLHGLSSMSMTIMFCLCFLTGIDVCLWGPDHRLIHVVYFADRCAEWLANILYLKARRAMILLETDSFSFEELGFIECSRRIWGLLRKLEIGGCTTCWLTLSDCVVWHLMYII